MDLPPGASHEPMARPGLELLRRLLILCATTLIVARPIVPGEDPGLLRSVSEPSGMVLTLCWFAVGLGWMFWRLRSGQGEWYAGWIEAALLAATVFVFISAEAAARYKHPALLIAWEWFGLLLAFCVVRQLATTPEERQGLFAALLASGVTFAIQAVFQAVQAQIQGSFPPPPATAAYAAPDSLAVFLVLILPALVWTVVLYHASHGPTWPAAVVGALALFSAAAIGLTYRPAAYLAVLLIGLPAAFLTWRSWRGHRYVALGVLVVLLAAGWGVCRSIFPTSDGAASTFVDRWETWQTTWRLLGERPWWGWGPGNFSRTFPRFMSETAPEAASEPHNFVLELWAGCGPWAALAVLVAFGAFFLLLFSRLRLSAGSALSRKRLDEETSHPPSAIRWEYYVGATLGLMLGFVLRVQELGPADILPEGFLAAARSIIWFGAFALFERAPWTDRGRALALATGVAGALVVLAFSDGIGYPSVAGLLWTAVALGVNSLSPRPVGWLSRNRVALALPLPVLAAVALLYFLNVFTPVASSAAHVQEGFKAGAYYMRQQMKWDNQTCVSYVQDHIRPHFQKAVDATPTDARTWVHLAIWTGELYAKDTTRGKNATEALELTIRARDLDPEGPTGYETRYSLLAEFAKVASAQADRSAKLKTTEKQPLPLRKADEEREKENRSKSRDWWHRAAKSLQPYLEFAPTDAFVHYQIAEALYRAEDWAGLLEQGQETLRLNEVSRRPRKLPDKKLKALQDRMVVAEHYLALEPRAAGR
jgi:O-antigen ligase